MSKSYKDEAWLQREYVEKQRSTTDMAEDCDVTATTIIRWLENFGIDRRNSKETQKPDKKYTKKQWLEKQYKVNKRSMADIGKECDVSSAVILKWLRRFEIETRESSYWKRVQPVSIVNSHGYQYVRSKIDGQLYSIGIHQLLAIAEGADPSKIFSNGKYHVHHKNGVRWDNRPKNIELISGSEHIKQHNKNRKRRETGEWV